MAAKFTFRLQPVLDQRERIEQAKQLVVAELERRRLGIEDRLRFLQREMDQAKRDLRTRLGGGNAGPVVVPEVRMQAGASLHMSAQARLAALELAGVYRRLERARQDLLKAATDRRAVELLKEKRREEWRVEQNRAETKAVDEAATQGYVRSSTEGAW
ncbi:MAG TPA: flagellar FliJ family protein [Phycisphaerales bacterium]|nr:flagellar FliJ family protein [Phycisphaerales bacterium]